MSQGAEGKAGPSQESGTLSPDTPTGPRARYDALFNAPHIVVLLVDPVSWEIVDANDAAVTFYGYERHELLSRRISDINTLPPDELAAAIGRAANAGTKTFSFRHRLASGAVRDVEVSSGPVVIDGRPLLYSIIQDITERREAAEREERLQRLYVASAEIDHRIARIGDADTLFDEACRIAVEVGGFRMAWVGCVDEASPTRQFEIVAAHGEAPDIFEDLRVAASESVPEGRGGMGRAVREGRTIVINDFMGEPGTAVWHDLATRAGYAAAAALPLTVPGRSPHVVAVYSSIPGAFGPAEVGLLERIVGDVAFRLQVLDGDTARRAAEEALRASEERYRTLVEQAPDGIVVLDEDARFVDATAVACQVLGISLDELRGKSVLDLSRPEFRQRLVERLVEIAKGEPFRYLFSYPHPAGHLVDIEAYGRRLADGRIQVIIRDVTAERDAAMERDRLAAAVEQAIESIAIVDLSQRIVYVNPTFEALSGYPKEEAIGQRITILRTGLLDDSDYEGIDSVAETGIPWTGRVVNRRKDGSQFELDLLCSPIRDRTGETVGIVEIGRDTTQERALEAQLAEAQRMEAVGRLAGGVAHDFNNLLTAISGYAQLALADFGDQAALREDIEEIRRAAGRATNLTRQLLAFSRRSRLQPRVLDMAAVIEGIAPMLRRLIGEDVRLEVLAQQGLLAMADPGQLEQVVMNLAVNARDAMPRGGRLRIDVHAESFTAADLAAQPGARPGEYVALVVSDTGTGIPAEVIDHVFEPFFTTKERGKGTGLGLSMVFGIVRQSNGFVTVDSALNQGATFSIFLPRAEGSVEEVRTHAAPAPVSRGSASILVVEDEPLVRAFARRVLEHHGFRVLEAGSGEEALAIAARELDGVDLLFTDVVMPSIGGRELAEQLLERKPDLRVLYATGYTDEALADRGHAGIASLDKPYTAEALVGNVTEMLATSRPSSHP